MPQGHNRHDMKWNSLQGKRLGLDSRVVDGGLLLDDPTTARVAQGKRGTPTDRPHGGRIMRGLDMGRALIAAKVRRSVMEGDPQGTADTSWIDRFDFPLNERFNFELRENKVVAFPAEMFDAPEHCYAQGCELMAGRGGDGLCAFHEMMLDDDLIPAERRMPRAEAPNGRMEWDGFAVEGERTFFGSTIIAPAPIVSRQAQHRAHRHALRERQITRWYVSATIEDRARDFMVSLRRMKPHRVLVQQKARAIVRDDLIANGVSAGQATYRALHAASAWGGLVDSANDLGEVVVSPVVRGDPIFRTRAYLALSTNRRTQKWNWHFKREGESYRITRGALWSLDLR